ncbi:MAG TPA: hypothetical protein VE983_08320 [Solirubrobacteraceae bacterium]|nr:hypothetical protein [Solirubrobacteraceae bacterium]
MRRIVGVAAAGLLLALIPALATAEGPHVCKGTFKKPGVLKAGTYPDGVLVQGACLVDHGRARVIGTLDVGEGAALAAAYGHSKLTVVGNVVVGEGGVLVLGCNTFSFPCLNDPAQTNHNTKPTLHSFGRVTGDVTGSGARGIIIHSSLIGGSVSQSGGGGRHSCRVPKKGAFAAFHSPIYSDYEDNTINGSLWVSDLSSCYLGIARNRVQNLQLTENQLADPDAIEVLSNRVLGNLACEENSQVWDSAETGHGLFPRKLERNHVAGQREGQCVRASRIKKGTRAKGLF